MENEKLGRKAYICGRVKYPRGGASANYIQYLAMALDNAGFEVHIISDVNKQENPRKLSENIYEYGGIEINSFDYAQGKIATALDSRFGNCRHINKILRETSASKGDIMISYSHNPHILDSARKSAARFGMTDATVVVEWFGAEFFDGGEKNKTFRFLEHSFNVCLPKYSKILPISTYIGNHFKELGVDTLVIPILADPYEYEYIPKKCDGVKKFIFPANGLMKDSLSSMLDAIGALTDAELKDCEFHFCGLKENALKDAMNDREKTLLGNKIILHKWLEYSELVALYREMHFLLLARDITQMTKANFPSKVPETMCYGIVPVASRVGDYTSLYLEDGVNSIVFDGCRTENVLAAIRRALSLDATALKNLSCNARACAETKFCYRVWSKKLKDFLLN